MAVQIIRTEGEDELVVLSRRKYVALLARAGDEAAEDEMVEHIVREARVARERDGDRSVPAWMSEAVLAGVHPLLAARNRLGLTQADLATRANIARGHLSAAENGRRRLSADAVGVLARLLALDPEWLAD